MIIIIYLKPLYKTMFRLLTFITFFLLSCKPREVTKKVEFPQSRTQVMTEGYRKSPNPDSSRILWYKTEQSVNAMAPWYLYFVTDKDGKEIILKEQRILAEKIYWKDKNTLAIIPYREMIQEESLENPNKNEILINIK